MTARRRKTLLTLFLVTVVVLLTFSAYSLQVVPSVYPHDREVLESPGNFEGEVVTMRGSFVEKDRGSWILERYGERVKLVLDGEEGVEVEREPVPGDVVDLKGVSHLEEGYVEALEVRVRRGSVHSGMFLRSLPAIPVVLFFLWRDRRFLFEGWLGGE